MKAPTNDMLVRGTVTVEKQPGFHYSMRDEGQLAMHFSGSSSVYLINALIQELEAVRDALGS